MNGQVPGKRISSERRGLVWLASDSGSGFIYVIVAVRLPDEATTVGRHLIKMSVVHRERQAFNWGNEDLPQGMFYMAKKILSVTDSSSMRAFVVATLQHDFDVTSVDSQVSALQAASKAKHHLLIVESTVFGASPLGVLHAFRKLPAPLPSIFLATPGREADAMKSGADKVLVKPVSPEELLAAVKALLT